jgi:hypothetical protein
MGRPRKRPDFVTIGAAIAGRRHEAEGIPCQDVVVHKSRRGNHVIALCDGAGSAQHAETGARALAAVVVNHVAGHLPHLLSLTEDQARQTIVGVARTALLRLAQRNRWDMASLATTLLFAATDGSTFLAGQLGDGRIGVRTGESASWLPLDTASRGEFSNETQFITSSHALGSLQLARCSMADVDACVLMSDGAEATLFQRRTAKFAAAVETMSQWARAESAARCRQGMAHGLRELLRTQTLDDVSVAFLVRQ